MVRYTDKLVMNALNLVTFVLSIPILGSGLWAAATMADTDCDKLPQWPLIAIGAFLIFISLAGFLGLRYRLRWLVWLYLVALLVHNLILFSSAVSALDFINRGTEMAVSGREYKEYKLINSTSWVEKRMDKSTYWNKTNTCLRDAKVCKSLADESVNEVAEQFYKRNLSPIQSGCCKPPSSCNFVYVNATFWTSRASNLTDMDCRRWSNEQEKLCYDCDSCKAGVIANLKHKWIGIVGINFLVVVLLFGGYSVQCSILDEIEEEDGPDERNRGGHTQ